MNFTEKFLVHFYKMFLGFQSHPHPYLQLPPYPQLHLESTIVKNLKYSKLHLHHNQVRLHKLVLVFVV